LNRSFARARAGASSGATHRDTALAVGSRSRLRPRKICHRIPAAKIPTATPLQKNRLNSTVSRQNLSGERDCGLWVQITAPNHLCSF
jgi:hypothetical protein